MNKNRVVTENLLKTMSYLIVSTQSEGAGLTTCIESRKWIFAIFPQLNWRK
ncbi:hypothetical protein [Nostoc sp.]|uniref:hypothetical protein n=1 Tax=Nostoc sp. TaxID=1180 RepID=UPI002FF5F734